MSFHPSKSEFVKASLIFLSGALVAVCLTRAVKTATYEPPAEFRPGTELRISGPTGRYVEDLDGSKIAVCKAYRFRVVNRDWWDKNPDRVYWNFQIENNSYITLVEEPE